VNRADRGPLLLIVAGVFLLLAVVAFLISDAEDRFQRSEATSRSLEALRVQTQRSIVELKALQEESDLTNRARADLDAQQQSILNSLARIEKLLTERPPTERGR
jgi:ABC-type bacteriocin/lantibiotic exporter with double-glycine peptidase domain